MADIDLYSGLAALPSLAAAYRMAIGSAANAGGYAPMSWFAYRDAAGVYQVGGQLGASNGNAASPGVSFSGDLNTGIFSAAADTIGFSTGGTERARLTSTGLGFGAAAPYAAIEIVKAAGGAALGLGSAPGTGSVGLDVFGSLDAIPAAQVRGWIGSGSGAVGVNGDLLIAPRTSAGCSIRFLTGATGGVERMRVTSNGDVGIGTLTPGGKISVVHTTAANRLIASFENSLSGDAWCSVTGGDCSGNIRAFGSTYATVPLQSLFAVEGGAGKNVGLLANGGDVRCYAGTFGTERFRIEAGGTVRPGADNSQSLGAAASRWSNIYAGNGTILTSDATKKLWRGAPNAAELRAAKRIAAELGFFQWLDKVAEEGAENARFHFGVRAQAVWAIMADEGLVDPIGGDGRPGATPYAFLCWDEWDAITEPAYAEIEIPAVVDEETGEEIAPARVECGEPTGETIVVREAGAGFGVRTDQLALFLIAAQEARIAALEAAA